MNKEIIFAYTAGIIDGEGTVTLTKNKKTAKFKAPCISVSSTTYSIVDFLCKEYGGCISKHKTYKSTYKQSWSWHIMNDAAIEMLSNIVSYLKEPEKVRRSYLILNKYKTVTPRNGKYTKEMLIDKIKFEEDFFQ